MEIAEGPIEAIEEQIDELSDMIDDLTNRAVQEDDNSLYIDKALLEEQQEVVDQLDELMEAHQGDFDRLSEIGDSISQKAEEFEKAIDASLDDIDYNFVKDHHTGFKKV